MAGASGPSASSAVLAQAQLAQLSRVDRRRRAGERIGARRRLRERDHVTDRIAAGEQRDGPVEPERDAAKGWRAVPQRLEQEAETRVRLILGHAERFEHAPLYVWRVDTDRPTADLGPVHHQVVGAAAPCPRIRVEVA